MSASITGAGAAAAAAGLAGAAAARLTFLPTLLPHIPLPALPGALPRLHQRPHTASHALKSASTMSRLRHPPTHGRLFGIFMGLITDDNSAVSRV